MNSRNFLLFPFLSPSKKSYQHICDHSSFNQIQENNFSLQIKPLLNNPAFSLTYNHVYRINYHVYHAIKQYIT